MEGEQLEITSLFPLSLTFFLHSFSLYISFPFTRLSYPFPYRLLPKPTFLSSLPFSLLFPILLLSSCTLLNLQNLAKCVMLYWLPCASLITYGININAGFATTWCNHEMNVIDLIFAVEIKLIFTEMHRLFKATQGLIPVKMQEQWYRMHFITVHYIQVCVSK